MQELALLISSLAGAASAVAVHKIPRGPRVPTIGASRRVRGEIDSLESERALLEKAVARLYDGGGLPPEKRDALLERYQGRISQIRSREQELKAAGSHPDLGPVGDSLIMLMDQKLAGMDARLRDISAKMQPRQEKPRVEKPARPRESKPAPAAVGDKSLDMVTLTVHSAQPARQARPAEPAPVLSAVATEPARPMPPVLPAVQPAAAPEPAAPPAAAPEPAGPPAAEEALPAAPPAASEPPGAAGDEYDDENLDSLKKDILTALEKIEQAEVE